MRPVGWARPVLDLLLPAGCAACRTWIPGGRGAPLVCARCRSRLRVASWPRCPRCHAPLGARRAEGPDCFECRTWPAALAWTRYAFVLEPPADDLVHALKYEGWKELAEPMGRALALLAPPEGWEEAVLVPVPTTARRLARRGYDQAELLARKVAAVRGVPLAQALARLGDAGSQTALSPQERRDNVRHAFAPGPGAGEVHGARVLLVDDVLTTGATASEAALTLTAFGARSVTLLAYARALPTTPGARP